MTSFDRKSACMIAALLLGLGTSTLVRGAEIVEPPPVPVVGSRLRVTAPGVSTQPVVGTLVEMNEREIVLSLSGSDRKAIPRSELTRVENSGGRKGHGKKGALIGAATGLTYFVVAARHRPLGRRGMRASYRWSVARSSPAAAALIGAGIGASIRTERWTPVASSDLRLGLRPTKGRGVAAALTWSW